MIHVHECTASWAYGFIPDESFDTFEGACEKYPSIRHQLPGVVGDKDLYEAWLETKPNFHPNYPIHDDFCDNSTGCLGCPGYENVVVCLTT